MIHEYSSRDEVLAAVKQDQDGLALVCAGV